MLRGVLLFCALAAVAVAVPLMHEKSKVSPAVEALLKQEGHADIVIRMATRANPVELVNRARLATRAAKATFVRDALLTVSLEAQEAVLALLTERNYVFESFWISNSIHVRGADEAIIRQIAARAEVGLVDVPFFESIHIPVSIETNVSAPNGNEWGVEKVSAPLVWATGNKGEGVVVANIDTGVRWTHEALVGSYRGAASNNNGDVSHNYNWFQPTGKSAAPLDNNGHGTHTMGTIAGTNGIGVAPGAKWIACQGCATFGCSEYDLTTCAQFLTCPTDVTGANPDCSKAPDVINNSWGGGQGSDWYDSFMLAWIAADIVPIFSMGNSGPRCGTANSPGDSPHTTAVGATDINDSLAYFSSRGPAINYDHIKPEVSAPGLNVRSAWYNADNAYSSISGTSMASPHVTGTVALMRATGSKASVEQIKSDLELTADTNLPPPTQGEKECGGTSYTDSPNYLYGYGRINACKAVAKEGGACQSK